MEGGVAGAVPGLDPLLGAVVIGLITWWGTGVDGVVGAEGAGGAFVFSVC